MQSFKSDFVINADKLTFHSIQTNSKIYNEHEKLVVWQGSISNGENNVTQEIG